MGAGHVQLCAGANIEASLWGVATHSLVTRFSASECNEQRRLANLLELELLEDAEQYVSCERELSSAAVDNADRREGCRVVGYQPYSFTCSSKVAVAAHRSCERSCCGLGDGPYYYSCGDPSVQCRPCYRRRAW